MYEKQHCTCMHGHYWQVISEINWYFNRTKVYLHLFLTLAKYKFYFKMLAYSKNIYDLNNLTLCPYNEFYLYDCLLLFFVVLLLFFVARTINIALQSYLPYTSIGKIWNVYRGFRRWKYLTRIKIDLSLI
jgi:hypothetical protein